MYKLRKMYLTIIANRFSKEVSYVSHLKVTKPVYIWKFKTYLFLNTLITFLVYISCRMKPSTLQFSIVLINLFFVWLLRVRKVLRSLYYSKRENDLAMQRRVWEPIKHRVCKIKCLECPSALSARVPECLKCLSALRVSLKCPSTLWVLKRPQSA